MMDIWSYSHSGTFMNKTDMNILVLIFRWTCLLYLEQRFWSLILCKIMNMDYFQAQKMSYFPAPTLLFPFDVVYWKAYCSIFPNLAALIFNFRHHDIMCLSFNYRCLVIRIILILLYISFAKCQFKPLYFPSLPLKSFEDIFICSKQNFFC